MHAFRLNGNVNWVNNRHLIKTGFRGNQQTSDCKYCQQIIVVKVKAAWSIAMLLEQGHRNHWIIDTTSFAITKSILPSLSCSLIPRSACIISFDLLRYLRAFRGLGKYFPLWTWIGRENNVRNVTKTEFSMKTISTAMCVT